MVAVAPNQTRSRPPESGSVTVRMAVGGQGVDVAGGRAAAVMVGAVMTEERTVAAVGAGRARRCSPTILIAG